MANGLSDRDLLLLLMGGIGAIAKRLTGENLEVAMIDESGTRICIDFSLMDAGFVSPEAVVSRHDARQAPSSMPPQPQTLLDGTQSELRQCQTL